LKFLERLFYRDLKVYEEILERLNQMAGELAALQAAQGEVVANVDKIIDLVASLQGNAGVDPAAVAAVTAALNDANAKLIAVLPK
jgi:hypothetical protein